VRDRRRRGGRPSGAATMVEPMCATMEHRGPDSHGLFADAMVALGVQGLAVIGVDGEISRSPVRTARSWSC
jgi:asparagine synthetase B (glutamine-hydrolysing)